MMIQETNHQKLIFNCLLLTFYYYIMLNYYIYIIIYVKETFNNNKSLFPGIRKRMYGRYNFLEKN